MSGRARSGSSGVRRALSVLLMTSLLSLGAGPLAATLGRGEDHRCACCPKGACKCCRRSGSPASGPALDAKLVCPGGCGCAGVTRTPVPIPYLLVPARHAGVQIGAALPTARAGAHPAGAPPNPLHQRPPPCLPA